MRNVLISAAGVFAAIGLFWAATTPADSATEQIEIGDFYFCALSFENGVCTTTITAGDTVTWNVTQSIHTVTECNATYTTCSGGFDSGLLTPGETFSQTFVTAGSYFYNCAVHPILQRGVVIVVAAATDTPPPTPPPGTPILTLTPTPASSQTAVPEILPPTGDGSVPADGSPLALLLTVAAVTLAIGAGLIGLTASQRTT